MRAVLSESLSSRAQEASSNELCSLGSLSDPFHQSGSSVISEELGRHCRGQTFLILPSDLLRALTWGSVAPWFLLVAC